jgi:CRP-like cAMP-binding protein
MTKPEQRFKEIALLEGLTDDQLALVARYARDVTFEPGSLLVHAGQPADEFYILTRGSVTIETRGPARGPLVIQTVEQGDLVGWSWMVEPYVWHFDARATVATRAIAVDARKLRKQCEHDPAFGYALLKRFVPVIAQRLEAARLQLLDLYDGHS